MVYFGEFIPQQVIEGWWWKNYSSHRSKMEVVKTTGGYAKYLSKYLSDHDFERAYFSQGWVFLGWVGFSKWIRKNWGQYPPKIMLVEMAKMPEEIRKDNEWYLL